MAGWKGDPVEWWQGDKGDEVIRVVEMWQVTRVEGGGRVGVMVTSGIAAGVEKLKGDIVKWWKVTRGGRMAW